MRLGPDMAEAGRKQAGLGLPGGEAAQWPLQRYGRFMPLGTGEPPGPGLEAGMASSPTWKVRPEGRKGREALTPAGTEGRLQATVKPNRLAPKATRTGGGNAEGLSGMVSRQLEKKIDR